MLDMGMFDGAYYLAGYSVECALKACIAKTTRRYEFPDKRKVDSSHSHSLRDLVRVAGLDEAHAERIAADAGFRKNWEVVQSWLSKAGTAETAPKTRENCLALLAINGME